MKGTLEAIIVIYLFCAVIFPETAGSSAHKIFNSLKAGWEQVQP